MKYILSLMLLLVGCNDETLADNCMSGTRWQNTVNELSVLEFKDGSMISHYDSVEQYVCTYKCDNNLVNINYGSSNTTAKLENPDVMILNNIRFERIKDLTAKQK